MRQTICLTLFLITPLASALAQHDHGAHSQYADQERSHIPSITMQEFNELQSGAGMGFAKPAELNHYPGPKHVLDLADSLDLTGDQIERIEMIRRKMSEEAVRLGKEYLHAEHALNELFSSGNATEEAVTHQAATVGEIGASLRSRHLVAHVQTAAVLTPAQIARYDELRGY